MNTKRLFPLLLLLAVLFASAVPVSGASEPRPRTPVNQHHYYYPFIPRDLAPPHLLAGLSYGILHESLWVIDWAGQSEFLIDDDTARLSPDGRYLVYHGSQGDPGEFDIWLEDLQTGAKKNLTNTPEWIDMYPEWIPNRSGLILFGTEKKPEHPFPFRSKPAIVHIDGAGYQVLDENGVLSSESVRADGSQIAYNAFGYTQGGIYTFEKGVQYLDPADYDLEAGSLGQPAWSSDGQYLAWTASMLEGQPYSDMGVAIFDLKNKTSWSLMYPYSVFRLDFLSWSPDQEWITFVKRDIETNGPWEIWALHALDHTLTRIGAFHDARSLENGMVWRYDGKYLAYNGPEEAIVVEAGTWKEVARLPKGSTPVDWFYPTR